MGKVIVILVILALLVGGVIYYKENEKEIGEYKQRKACSGEAKRVATTYEGKVDERIQNMVYTRCLKEHNLQ